MKTFILSIACCLALQVSAQVNPLTFDSTRSFVGSRDAEIGRRRLLMSDPGLNILFARKINTYLSGTGDLSLNRGYFIIDPTDGRLFLGRNFALSPEETDKRTKYILTTGIKTNVADGFSTIYSGEDKKLSENIGASLKLTWLFRGTLNYDSTDQLQKTLRARGIMTKGDTVTQRDMANCFRLQKWNEVQYMMRRDSIAFDTAMKGGCLQEYDSLRRRVFFDERNAYYKRLLLTSEVDFIVDEDIYSSIWDHWLSLDVYIPFASQEINTSDDFVSTVNKQYLYNFEGILLYSRMYETKKTRWLGTIGAGVRSLNNVKTEMLDKYSFNEYKDQGGTDTVKMAELKTKDVYIGKYESYWIPYARVQLVSMFIAKKMGVSFLAEKHFGSYDPMNVKLGIPVSLAGKDENSPVNFELQFKWNDYFNDIYPNKSRSEKFVIGLSVGIPLTSKLY